MSGSTWGPSVADGRPADQAGGNRSGGDDMKELVQYLARYLVNNPDAVEVKETQGDTASVLELKGRA